MAPWCSVAPSSCPVGAWTTGWRRMGGNYKLGKRVPASADGACRRALSKPPGDPQAEGERAALAAIGLKSSNPGSELPSPSLALHEASTKMQPGTWGAGLPLLASMRSAQPRGRNAELGRLLAAAPARGPRSFSSPRRLVCQTRGTRAGLHFHLARVAALRPIRFCQ